ncbi:MAG: methyltransferase [Chloroflexota bacterium]
MADPHEGVQPETIHRITRDVWPGFALLAGVQLDLFTPLSRARMTPDELAAELEVRPGKLRPLLYALKVFGLLEESGGQFQATEESATFLSSHSEKHLEMMARITPFLWGGALNTHETVRTGQPQAALDFTQGPREQLERFVRSLHSGSRGAGKELLKRFDLSGRERLLDLGGGSGGLAVEITRSVPGMRAVVADLPSIIPTTRAVLQEEDADESVEAIPLDAVNEVAPGRYDVVAMKALLQVLSPEDARRAVLNACAALEPGGEMHVIGSVLDDSRDGPEEAVRFNLALINLYDAGEAHTEGQHREWMNEAGLVEIGRVEEPGYTGMYGKKPPAP